MDYRLEPRWTLWANPLDNEGISRNDQGQAIDIKDYFISESNLEYNAQRERIYTKQLANKIVASYLKHNVVLSSHLVAYSAFLLLQKKHATLDIISLIKLDTDDFEFEKIHLLRLLDILLSRS